MTADREIVETWVAALRSGEYEQGTGELEREGRYCCLGVFRALGFAPRSTGSLFAVDAEDWAVVEPILGEGYRWANLNDRGCSFLKIADEIEKTIKRHDQSVDLKARFKARFRSFGYGAPLPLGLAEEREDYPVEWAEACQEFESEGGQ